MSARRSEGAKTSVSTSGRKRGPRNAKAAEYKKRYPNHFFLRIVKNGISAMLAIPKKNAEAVSKVEPGIGMIGSWAGSTITLDAEPFEPGPPCYPCVSYKPK